MYDTSGGVARERRGYALGERRRQGSGQVSDERTLVGLTCAPLSRRDTQAAAPFVVVYCRATRATVAVSSLPSVPVRNCRVSWIHLRRRAAVGCTLRARSRRLASLFSILSHAEKGADRAPRGFDPFDRRAERGAGVLAPRERVFVAHGSADSS